MLRYVALLTVCFADENAAGLYPDLLSWSLVCCELKGGEKAV
jgi:hypothetical protein